MILLGSDNCLKVVIIVMFFSLLWKLLHVLCLLVHACM